MANAYNDKLKQLVKAGEKITTPPPPQPVKK
jgi:hypothetical protein